MYKTKENKNFRQIDGISKDNFYGGSDSRKCLKFTQNSTLLHNFNSLCIMQIGEGYDIMVIY